MTFAPPSNTEQRIIMNRHFNYEYLDWEFVYNIFTLYLRTDLYGNTITLVHMPENSLEYKDFVVNILRTNLVSYKRILKSNKAAGSSGYVIRAIGSADALIKIRNTKTSIGYIDNFVYINRGDRDEIQVINLYNYTNF